MHLDDALGVAVDDQLVLDLQLGEAREEVGAAADLDEGILSFVTDIC